MEVKAFEAAPTSEQPEKWQEEIINKAKEIYKGELKVSRDGGSGEIPAGFDGFAREVAAKKKMEWKTRLETGNDPKDEELVLAGSLLATIKEMMKELKEAE